MEDGGRDFGRPGSILRWKGADSPGVPNVHRSRESRLKQEEPLLEECPL